jgi:hypothetical protein
MATLRPQPRGLRAVRRGDAVDADALAMDLDSVADARAADDLPRVALFAASNAPRTIT